MDKAEVEKALQEDRFPQDRFEKYDEKNPGFWRRFSHDKERYLHLLNHAISRLAYEGNCVILGRGSQILLSGIPGVLYLRVTAPFDARVAVVAQETGTTRQQAEHMVHQSDRERAGFHRFFFGEDWTRAELYDLVINTEHLSMQAAADLSRNALKALQRPEYEDETAQKLADYFLQTQIITRIICVDTVPVHNLKVSVDNGTVHLRGMVNVEADVTNAERSAATVEGVKSVQSEIYYVPPNTSSR